MKKEEIISFIKNLKIPTKRQYLLGFAAVVAFLAIVRPFAVGESCDTVDEEKFNAQSSLQSYTLNESTFNAEKKHRILSVPNYKMAFPDSQSVQIVAANKWGVKPVKNREDAEARKKELVYVGESPYYHVDRLNSSIPYLVPRAAMLLQDIGQAFYDSLYMKGVPLNQLIVTSVLRTKEDVARLQRHNNRYHAIGREVRNDTLKWVLSEVLRDIRQQDRAYIKYEVKQGCFHMTVR